MPVTEAKELTKRFLDEVLAIPGGEKIMGCIQCGTCSASCPTSFAMEYAPRQIIAALRADRIHDVLRSNTVWLCASCYSCAVRCPAGIPFTDVMYELKRLGQKQGIIPAEKNGQKMARAFSKTVDKYGRSHEFKLMLRYFFSTNPFKALGQMTFAMRMFFKGRLELGGHKIKGIKSLQKMVNSVEESG